MINDNDLLEKMHALSILIDSGKKEAFRIYPELKDYIEAVANLEFEVAKAQLLNKSFN